MIEYCLGFGFSETLQGVILIEKQTPIWQKGLLNGVGGKIEDGETALEAMRREFREETSVDVEGWLGFGNLSGDGWKVHLFTVKLNPYNFKNAKTITSEKVQERSVYNLGSVISNLTWLVPMALDSLNTRFGFEINEINLH